MKRVSKKDLRVIEKFLKVARAKLLLTACNWADGMATSEQLLSAVSGYRMAAKDEELFRKRAVQ